MRLLAALAAIGVLAPVAVTACTPSVPTPPPYTLRMLASSELGNMVPILAQAAAATGVTVRLTTTGTLIAAQEVKDGTAQRHYDAVWFASDDYIDLFPHAANDLAGTMPIMSSPVVLAVRSAVARRLGWEDGQATWTSIAEAAASGQFTFGMASPVSADAGLSGLVAAATAIGRPSGALQEPQIPGAVPELTGLFHGQQTAAPDSRDLLQEYLRDLEHPRRGTPDGIIDHEADLIALQAKAPRTDPLTLVYPSDGVIEAHYPLSLLTTAPPAARAAFERLVGYLTRRPVQQQIMTATHRRPVVPMTLASDLPAHLDPLRFPGDPATVQALVSLYLGRLRAPDATVYVLDTSASMSGPRLAGLRQALRALTGLDPSLAGKLSDFRTGEEVTFVPFNYGPEAPATYSIPAGAPAPALAAIRGYVSGLRAHGRTAIYDALVDAYRILKAQDVKAPGRIDSIVLLTDGENDWGRSLGDFLTYYRSLSASSAPAPVYPIALGQADLSQLQQVASITGGTLFNSEREPLSMLSGIIKDIRGYQ